MERRAALHRRLTGDAPAGVLASLARLVLIPLGWLYGAIGRLRACLYRRAVLSSYRATVPVISVGNITVGGTGKTPAVDLLVKLLLAEGKRVAVVSRGYGVRFRGVRVVSSGEGPIVPPSACGDEPYLLARRNPGALVLVAPRRRDGVRAAERELGAEVVILDDGFQHLAVKRDLDVVLLDARRPLGNGRPLPAGTLREAPSALGRGDLFLLTRCPEPLPPDVGGLPGPLLHSRHMLSAKALSLEGREIPLTALAGMRGVAFAGVAEPESFFAALSRAGLTLVERFAFVDHVPYGPAEIERLTRAAAGADYLVTTEKDGVKLPAASLPVPCYQVPMTLQVLEAGELVKIVRRTVRRGELI